MCFRRRKMKLFKLLQKNLEDLGFSRNHQPFNRRHLLFYLEGFLIFASFIMFICFVANSVIEFMNSIYMISAGITTFVSFTSTILKAPTMFHFFDYIEQFVNSSE